MRIAAVLAVTAALVAAADARPVSVTRIYRALDLYGTWAPNCAETPSPDNPRVHVAESERRAVLEEDDFGPAYEVNRYVIVAARRMSGHRLALDVLFQQADSEPQRQLIVMRLEDRTRRTMFTATADEPPRVKDGIAVAVGKPTPLLNKCD
jgi:hypothetical protein